MDLDMQMSDPAFWNDPDKAKKISQEATLLKTEVEGHEELVRKADDLSEYLEMAMEDGDASFAEDIEKQYHDLLKDIEKREVRLLLSGGSPGLGADAHPHVYPLGRTQWL